MEKTNKLTQMEASTILRVFLAIEHQIEVAMRDGRLADALAMCRTKGTLIGRIFPAGEIDGYYDSPLCDWAKRYAEQKAVA